MKAPTTTLLITNFPKEIKNAILSDPEKYFIHLGNLCGTVTRFKIPKPGVMFITMLSIPEAEKLKTMLNGLRRKDDFRFMEFKNVDQRVKNYQVIALIGDNVENPLRDEYTKNSNLGGPPVLQANQNQQHKNVPEQPIQDIEEDTSERIKSLDDSKSVSKSASNSVKSSSIDTDSESSSDSSSSDTDSSSDSASSSDSDSSSDSSSDSESSSNPDSESDSNTKSNVKVERISRNSIAKISDSIQHSVWEFIDMDRIESYVRWRNDGIWFFVLKQDFDPKLEMDSCNEKLYQTFGSEIEMSFIHAKCPLPSNDVYPEGFTGRFNRIFLGHLSIGMEEQCIRSHFSSFGKIKHVQIPKKENGRTKGIAFIDYYDNLPVKLALLKNNMYYSENQIVVKEATEERKSSQSDNGELFMQGVSVVEAAYESTKNSSRKEMHQDEMHQKNQDDTFEEEENFDDYKKKWLKKENEVEDEVDPCQVFVCNVVFEAPPRKVKKFFKKSGEIAEFRPIMQDGNFSGKAFIKFENPEGAQKALACNKMEFMGRSITVREVRVSSKKRKRNETWEKNKKQRQY